MSANPQATENALNNNYALHQNLYRSLATEAPLRAYASAESLESLGLLARLHTDMAKAPAHIKSAYEQETKYLNAALDALSKDEVLRGKFGQDLSGAQVLAAMMRQDANEQEVRARLSQYIPSDVKKRIDEPQIENLKSVFVTIP